MVGAARERGRPRQQARPRQGHADIPVPAKVWKVVLVLRSENAEPRKNARVIAVIMPNDQSVDLDWAEYRVHTRDVEKFTGYLFFRGVQDEEMAQVLCGHQDEVKVRDPRESHRREGGRRR